MCHIQIPEHSVITHYVLCKVAQLKASNSIQDHFLPFFFLQVLFQEVKRRVRLRGGVRGSARGPRRSAHLRRENHR